MGWFSRKPPQEPQPPPGWQRLVPPLLAGFVSDRPGRHAATWPFWHRGFLYATDGRIVIRTAAPDPGPFQRPLPVPVGDVFESLGGYGEPLPCPDPGDTRSARTCPMCDGTGRRLSGWRLFGGTRCGSRDGEGRIPGDRAPVEVAPGVFVSACYIRALFDAGAVLRVWREHPGTRPVMFTTGTFDGLVMPMRVPGRSARSSDPHRPRP